MILFFLKINSVAEEFKFESNEVQILEKGNLILIEDNVKILAKDNLKIEANKSEYDKKNNSLKVFGNVKITDQNNDIIINAEKINYLKNDEIIFTEGKSIVQLEENYFINSTNLNLNRNLMKFSSNKKTIIDDSKGYNFILEEFEFDIKNKILIGKNVYLKDLDNNSYYLKTINLNLDNYDFSGENYTLILIILFLEIKKTNQDLQEKKYLIIKMKAQFITEHLLLVKKMKKIVHLGFFLRLK